MSIIEDGNKDCSKEMEDRKDLRPACFLFLSVAQVCHNHCDLPVRQKNFLVPKASAPI